MGIGLGSWVAVLQGTGSYANGDDPGDADRVIRETTTRLRDLGQHVTLALFVTPFSSRHLLSPIHGLCREGDCGETGVVLLPLPRGMREGDQFISVSGERFLWDDGWRHAGDRHT